MKWPLLLAFYLCTALVFAQAPATWGIKSGFNLSQHYGTKGDEGDYDVNTGLRSGFIGGVFLDYAASEILSLRLEALYSMKGSRQKIGISKMEIDGLIQDLVRPAQMNVSYYLDYFELPVLLRLKTLKREKLELSLITGWAMGLKLHANHQLDGKVYFPGNGDDIELIEIRESSRLREVNMFDFSMVYGGSLDFKTRLPLSLEYRFTLGWDYLSLPTYEFFEPVELRNQTWSVLLSSTF
ncbi:MAG: porin family protein [Candidatus Cloacimonadaceae bacterium]|nr:PorT family protein [Candidatus Cloacimonadota bacterium]MDY0127681.1 porin family protein [Candidatus Cloacimonadaceae bacterium]MCB5254472.1 PorT family protein [Candidatus Cloacimonadota bacterium]MCK9178132.1 PorT family protein [Candidatus Cloacimonadota bacterium]MCK9241963.1 PorT family protein [Candidatus Cloacimonadota bacterium]